MYKKIKCKSCGTEFVWSVEEQRVYKERGLGEPEYCGICRGMMEARKRDKARIKYER